MLTRKKRALNHYERFYRVATEPLYYIKLADFYNDLNELIASKGFKSTNFKITIEDFCEFFS